MKFKRKYLAPLLLIVLYPIGVIVNKEADKSSNKDTVKRTIYEWSKVHDKFPNIAVKRAEHPDVGIMLDVTGSVKSPAELAALHDWFSSEWFQDEADFSDIEVPSSTSLVRYDVTIAENQNPGTPPN